MIANAYGVAVELTARFEGGWYDGKGSHDPNPTMKGVTQNTYDGYRDRSGLPRRSVREITDGELRAIYRDYWTAVSADRLPPGVAVAVFDHGFNAGPPMARKILQRALGVRDDGIIGPITLGAVAAADPEELFRRVLFERLAHYREIAAAKPALRPALLSWIGRIVDTERRARLDGWFDSPPPLAAVA